MPSFLAGAAYAGYQTGKLHMTDIGPYTYSVSGVMGSLEALAFMATINLPANYAAAWGGLVGASCALAGTMAGLFFYQYKH